MRMRIREQPHLVEFWLTNQEKNNPAIREYTAQDYLVAVFLSGEADLYQQTRDLLLYNRRRLAEKEVLRQKPEHQTMTV